MPDVVIQDQNRGILRVTFERIGGEGRILPTIVVVAQMQTLEEAVTVVPFNMDAKLKLGNDTVAQGGLRRCGTELTAYPRQETFEMQTTQRAINFVNEQFREDYLSFSLYLDSLINYTDKKQQFSKLIKPSDNALMFRISKTDWLKQVLEPIKYADFTLLELPVPVVPNREQ